MTPVVWAAMTAVRRASPVLLPTLLALLLAACTTAPAAPTASSPSPAPSSAPSSPPVSAAPPAPSGTDGGAVGGNPGVTPIPIGPGGPGASGGFPAPSPIAVEPVAGLLNVHDVHATGLEAGMSGNHLTATVVWWSGPTPCSDLAEVHVDRTANAFSLTVREGARQLGVACPALAVYKSTAVDLGQVVPGTYTVAVLGVDRPVVVVFAG